LKVEIHSTFMDNLMTPFFYDSIKEFATKFNKENPEAKKLQFYSDFFLPNAKYPFVDYQYVYYPLTVIYNKCEWKTIWICWDNDESILSLKSIPFTTLKKVTICVCDSVPEKFINYVKNKKYVFIQDSRFVQPIIHTINPLKNIGKINQNFVDVISQKISLKLIECGCEDLNSKWSLEICDTDSTHTLDGKNYRIVTLSNWQAECIQFGVCWSKEYGICDYIDDVNIDIDITEKNFDKRASSFSEILLFVKNNGFKY